NRRRRRFLFIDPPHRAALDHLHGNRSFLSILRSALPERGGAAIFAIADNACIDEVNIGFQIALFDGFARLATPTLHYYDPRLLFFRGWCWELDAPEILRRIQKGHAVSIEFALDANLTDQANFGLFVRIQAAENQFLLRGKFIARDNAGPVPAKQHGFRLFGENLAFDIAANHKDSNLLRNSAASAYAFGGHSFTHSERTLFR